MNKKFKLLSVFFLSSLLLASCGGDDNNDVIPTDDEQMEDIDEQRTATIEILTNGASQTWKISNAELDVNGTFLNLSDNFNVIDDEFIFSGTTDGGSIEWRPGNAINLNGTTNQETLLDYYLSPIVSPFSFNEESSTDLNSLNGAFTFELQDNGSIKGILTTSGRNQADGELNITLTVKTPSDYVSIPQNGLNFSLVTNLPTGNSGLIGGDGALGFKGSNSDNSFYIVSRDNSQNDPNLGSPEQILKYDVDTNTFTENLFYQQQFVTKRLNIINNELVVFGAQFANTYPLNLNGDPTTVYEHNLQLTRFGFAVEDDFAYTVGGSTANDAQPAVIRKYNYVTNEIQEIATLPVPRFYGGSEIVNGQLYTFGGRPTFNGGNNADATSFKVDLTTGGVIDFLMPDAPFLSYASKKEHLIYVGYETRIDDGSGDENQFDREINFGVYNTIDDTFTTLPHNLDDSGQFEIISGITVINNMLYVIYGSISDTTTISIYRASI